MDKQDRIFYADCFHEWETCLGGTHSWKVSGDPQNPKGMFDISC